MPGNDPRETGVVSAFRTFYVDLQIVAPTVGALEDFERELKKAIRRTVNTQTRAKRHGVTVRPPGMGFKKTYPDTDFWVLTSAVPTTRRARRHG